MTGSFICIIVDQSCFLLEELFLRKIGEIIEVVIPGFFSFFKFQLVHVKERVSIWNVGSAAKLKEQSCE